MGTPPPCYYVTAIRDNGTLIDHDLPKREDCDDYAPTDTNCEHPLMGAVIDNLHQKFFTHGCNVFGIQTLTDGSMHAVLEVQVKDSILLPTLTSTQVDAPTDASDWDASASHWRCTLTYQGRRMSVQYHMGSAHKGKPDLLSVLGSLFLDASSGDVDFSDFCSEFGYDADSRKAEKTWKACASMHVRLHKLLGQDYDLIREYVDEKERG
jgi:hypothetical protein